MTDQKDGRRTTDDNCLGCCRCPQCGVAAYWSFQWHIHTCADPKCAYEFMEHDDTQFTKDRTND